ncbi:hypothetical protein OF83DRAFT_1267553 [Amylostereum chailletii]|nr:hypothetical protein OF83DRAFT_1267553 [Amylostereum chailletii]
MNTCSAGHCQGGVQEKTYNEPEDRFWSLYLTDAGKNDAEMTENMKGDTDGLLIFTGLFAAIVSAFIIEFYKTLNSDPGDTTVTLLSDISSQISAVSNGTQAPRSSLPGSFHVPPASVRINSLWFISLFLSVYVALASTLVQQWCCRYLRAARRRGPPHKRGPIHVVVSKAMKRFHVKHVVEVIVALLHISVFLFLGGLLDFLFIINPSVAHAFIPFIASGGFVYFGLTILPFFSPSSPYDTPLTHLVRVFIAVFYTVLSVALFTAQHVKAAAMRWSSDFAMPQTSPSILAQWASHARQTIPRLYRTRKRVLEDLGRVPSQQSAEYALRITLKALDEEWETEEFLASLPGFFDSAFVGDGVAPDLVVYLIQHQSLVDRMHNLIWTCLPWRGSSQLSEARTVRRIQAILGTLQDGLARIMRSPIALDRLLAMDEELQAGVFLSEIVDTARMFSNRPGTDPYPALTATCALAQLRDTMMRGMPHHDDANVSPNYPASVGESFLFKLLKNMTLDDHRPGRIYFDPLDPRLRWTTSTNNEASAPILGHGGRYAEVTMRRGGYLDNLNCFIRRIWPVPACPLPLRPFHIWRRARCPVARRRRPLHLTLDGYRREAGLSKPTSQWRQRRPFGKCSARQFLRRIAGGRRSFPPSRHPPCKQGPFRSHKLWCRGS